MKKLLTLVLVLAMASAVWAGTGEIRVAPDDAKDSYEFSDIITIEIVADFGVGTVTIDDITTDNGGTASNPRLAPELSGGYIWQPGTIVNAGGILVSDIAGDGGVNMGIVPAGNFVFAFDFHVPGLPGSTIFTIGVNNINMTDQYYQQWVTDVGSVQIHLAIPEPMTIALLGLGGLFLRRRK